MFTKPNRIAGVPSPLKFPLHTTFLIHFAIVLSPWSKQLFSQLPCVGEGFLSCGFMGLLPLLMLRGTALSLCSAPIRAASGLHESAQMGKALSLPLMLYFATETLELCAPQGLRGFKEAVVFYGQSPELWH